MDFNFEKQKLIDDECACEIALDPYVLTEYRETYSDLDTRGDIYRIVGASHSLGLDLSPLQAFQIWGCLSSGWGCSGWMDAPKGARLTSFVEEAVELYLRKK
jgi:hypothetical protein